MPQLTQAKEVQAIDMHSIARADKGRVGMAKLHAAQHIDLLRSVLFPED